MARKPLRANDTNKDMAEWMFSEKNRPETVSRKMKEAKIANRNGHGE